MGRRIGILGGAFDPPHIGHLILAEAAYRECGVDEVVFVPYYSSGDKQPAASPKDRLEMIRLSVKGIDYFSCSDIEIKRGGKTYTIDTVNEILRKEPDCQLFWIIGSDSARGLTSWKEWENLIKLVRFIVGYRQEPIPEKDYFIPVSIPYIGISSSEVRRRLREGNSVRFMIPEAVREYIIKRGLYR